MRKSFNAILSFIRYGLIVIAMLSAIVFSVYVDIIDRRNQLIEPIPDPHSENNFFVLGFVFVGFIGAYLFITKLDKLNSESNQN